MPAFLPLRRGLRKNQDGDHANASSRRAMQPTCCRPKAGCDAAPTRAEREKNIWAATGRSAERRCRSQDALGIGRSRGQRFFSSLEAGLVGSGVASGLVGSMSAALL